MVPLPILYHDDDSLDLEGLSQFVQWQMSNGTKNFFLTFTFSQLDSVTPDEIVQIIGVIRDVVRDEAVFVPCTGGGPLHVAIETVKAFEQARAHAAFVHLPEFCLQNGDTGDLYIDYIREVARRTSISLLAVARPVYGVLPPQPLLTAQRLERLCSEVPQFIGIKDDIYILANRMELTRRLSGRMEITGGGMFSHYIYFHHHPHQREFAGIRDPKRAQHMFLLLDRNDYLAVLKMMEQESADPPHYPPGLHWMARNQVVFYGMGFARSYRMRPPLPTATVQQAEAIIQEMHARPQYFERIER